MAYTIKGLAKATECKTFDAQGLASVWDYWFICNCEGRKDILKDFKSLRKADRKEMLDVLQERYPEIRVYILENMV